MNANRILLGSVVALTILPGSLIANTLHPLQQPPSELVESNVLENSIPAALKNDEVIVKVHDSKGNLVSEQKTHNIITSAGAIYFCIQMNRCESHITGESPNVVSTTSPTWWI